MFYVYEWYNTKTNEIIYVGKGTRRRYKVRKHNRMFDDFIKRFPCDSRIVKVFEREQDAFEYEAIYIAELKSKGQCACNINKGGKGGNVAWWTSERRKEYSEKNIMKTNIQRLRMKRNNPMKNPVVANKTNAKKKKAVIINGITFESVNAAALNNKVCANTIIKWCKRGYDTNGNQCKYFGQEQKKFCIKKTNSKKVKVDDMIFNSVKEAAKYLDVWSESIIRSIKNNKPCKGHICRYDNQQPSCENPLKVSQKVQRLTGEDGNQ